MKMCRLCIKHFQTQSHCFVVPNIENEREQSPPSKKAKRKQVLLLHLHRPLVDHLLAGRQVHPNTFQIYWYVSSPDSRPPDETPGTAEIDQWTKVARMTKILKCCLAALVQASYLLTQILKCCLATLVHLSSTTHNSIHNRRIYQAT